MMDLILKTVLPGMVFGALGFAATQHSIEDGVIMLIALSGSYLTGYFGGKRDR